MNAETKNKRNVLSFDQQLLIYNFLKDETVLTVINPEEKIVAYLDGWSDERVAAVMAEKLGSAVTANNVQGIRAGQFGDLRMQSPNENRLTKLEQQVEAQAKRITELQGALANADRVIEGKGQAIIDMVRKFNGLVASVESQAETVRKLEADMSRIRLKGKFS